MGAKDAMITKKCHSTHSNDNYVPSFHLSKTYSLILTFAFLAIATLKGSDSQDVDIVNAYGMTLREMTSRNIAGLSSTNDTNDSAHWATDPQRATSVTPNHEPKLNDVCDFQMYKDFNQVVASNKASDTPYNKAVGKSYFNHPHATKSKPKIMDPKDLCIRTDSQKNIDLVPFDCFPDKLDTEQVKGYCDCGTDWSLIDLNDHRSYLGLNNKSHAYEYQGFSGLNKYLRMEEQEDRGKFECVAQRFGHCTLEVYKKRPSWNFTRCKRGFKCRNVSVWNPTPRTAIYNPETDEWYGICISQRTPDDLRDPYSSSQRESPNLAVILGGVIIIIMFRACFDNHSENKRQNKCHSKFNWRQ